MKLKLPLQYLKEARQAVLNAAGEFTKIEKERLAMPLSYEAALKSEGEKGARAWLDAQERFSALERKVSLCAQEKIEKARAAYIEGVNAQIVPNGEDLSSADYALLRDGIIDTPQALQAVIARNDNYAFVAAAAKYAKARNWEGFENNLDVDVRAFLDFGGGYLDICSNASENPVKGYNGMLVADCDEMGRRADAYGIGEAFSEAAGGEAE